VSIRVIRGRKKENMKPSKEWVRILKFVLFSASAGIIQFGSFALLNELTPWRYWPCYLISLILSILWNFTFNRRFTFRSNANITRAMLLVLAFYAVFTPATTLLGNWLAEDVHWNEYMVTIINMLLNLTLEYLYQRFVVYRNHIDNR
jgi:putative flippase GtrA